MAIVGLLMTAPALGQSVVDFIQQSSPAGIVSQSTSEETGTVVTSVVAPNESAGYHFVEWQIGGVRQEDYLGVATTSFSFTILEPTTITAIYIPSSEDTDGDGIEDWYERRYYGNLDPVATDDTDGDGFTLLEEKRRGYHPKKADQLVEGGVSRRQSESLVVNLAGYLHYQWSSNPPGIVDESGYVAAGTTINSPALLGNVVSGYRFAYWSIDGIIQSQSDGSAKGTLSATLQADLEAVAHYVPEAQDSDGDQIPDWYEWNYYSNLDESGSSDSDGDGWTLAEEYARGYHPLRNDTLVEGGISRRRSVSLDVNLAGYKSYHWVSSPAGIINISGTQEQGTVATTPNLWGQTTSGYRFAYWLYGDLPQSDSNGQALGQLSITLDNDQTATAVYLLETEDSDSDGIPDWYEWNYYTGLTQDGSTDTDGDGWTLAQEYARGYHPLRDDTLVEGGVSRRLSASLSINLQPFERMEFIPLNGQLAKVFSWSPNTVTGIDYGSNTHPLLGDWDGDGDFDLFVLHEDGLIVYENTGSVYYMKLADRSGAFGALSSLVAGIDRPTGALADVNQDGFADLALGGNRGIIEIILSNGGFANGPGATTFTIDTGGTRASPALGDFTGDGLADLVILMDDGTVRLHANTGNVSAPFEATASNTNLLPTIITGGVSISSAQINGDALTDLLVSDSLGRLWEFHANSPGNFTLVSKVWGGSGEGFASGLTITAADINGDGDDDAFGGTSDGALIGLIDPRVGAPADLIATPGADSIWLTWEPNRQARILGYRVYRSAVAAEPWSVLTDPYLRNTEYVDDAPLRPSSSYRVTGLTGRRLPGNTAIDIVESEPSEVVTASSGQVTMTLHPSAAGAGQTASILLSIDNALRIRGEGLEIRVNYDASKLTPVTQTDPTSKTTWKTGLSQSLSITDNSSTATGVLIITGSGGILKPGKGKLFNLRFIVNAGLSNGEVCAMSIASATLQDTSAASVSVSLVNNGGVTVAQAFMLGDLDGDGDLDQDDKAILIELMKKNSRQPTADELRAGDLNGDGVITPKDLVLFVRLINGLRLDEEFNP